MTSGFFTSQMLKTLGVIQLTPDDGELVNEQLMALRGFKHEHESSVPR